MPEITNADNTVVSVPKKQKVRKQTYCKKCGSLIDNKTKKCAGCRKQYFRLSKRVYIIVLVFIISIGLIGANVYQYIENAQAVKQLNDKLEVSNDSLELSKEVRAQLVQKCDDLSTKFAGKELELMFWEKTAVICTATGKKYHHYGCYHLNDCEVFWIYNINAAKSLGYTPCLDCCGG